jgi:hypothetical protein
MFNRRRVMKYADCNTYSYDGPVLEFGKVVSTRWSASTYARSEKEARRNLVYQFKQKYGKTVITKIELPGKIVKAG